MNSHALTNNMASTRIPGNLLLHRTTNSLHPPLFPSISHAHSMLNSQHGSPTKLSLTLKPLPSSYSQVRFSHFLSGQSLHLAPLSQRKQTFVKKETKFIKKAPTANVEASIGRSRPDDPQSNKIDVKPGDAAAAACAQKLKIGVYFAAWWGLNVVFNIYNKKVLNVYPFPWLTATLSLAAGSSVMIVLWALKIVEAPQVDCEFWKRLAPVAIAHTIGHVAATVSMSKVAVSFTHIIKSAEPAFSVLIQRLVFGEHFPLTVYVSLLPVIGGCVLAASTELHFNIIGFAGAMISNIAFVFRNIFSKRGMSDKGKNVGGLNYYACLSMMSLALLTPFAFVVEGPKVWVEGWKATNLVHGNQVLWWVVAQSVFYHLYNQVSYMSLDEISPLTFSIGNTIKRVTVIVSSILIFHTKILPINVAGAAIAIWGTFLYSQIKQ